MNKLIAQSKLLLKAWPLFVAVMLMVVHYFAIQCLSYPKNEINKLISLVLQLAGGLFVLWSIDSNMGIMTGSRLQQAFVAYLKKIKQAGKAVSISVHGLASATSISNATLTTRKVPRTIEEKIDDLQFQFNDLKSDVQKQSAGLHQKITDVQSTLEGQIRATQSSLEMLQCNVKEVTIGGIKLQLFGIYLVIHGAVAGYLA